MIYQRHIPQDELFSAQLETLMQNGRVATLSAHMVGAVITVLLFWQHLGIAVMLLWASVFLILLMFRSLQMSNALFERRYQTHPRRVYRQLLVGSAITGAIWSAVYIFAASRVPSTMQYMFLLVVVMITAFSLGYSVIIREYFITYVFTSLFPIAWWSLVHYWEHSYNVLIGLLLLAFCAVLVSVSERVYQTFNHMIALNWERETMSLELSNLTGSLRDRNRQLQDARRQLTDLANVDELTGLGNRRMINTVLKDEVNRARRVGSQLSLILLDVDYFKNYNDTYGHPAGDLVLKRLADLMQSATSRAGEVVGRYGGEEFILVLPGASPETALRTANRIRKLINGESIAHEKSEVASHITVSQGVVTAEPEADFDVDDLIERADAALYQAKHLGRNTISVA